MKRNPWSRPAICWRSACVSCSSSRTHLRTEDAIYVWVAEREGLPLVTFDTELLTRAPLAGVIAFAP
jgi:predicted nucleic acid-binding protein